MTVAESGASRKPAQKAATQPQVAGEILTTPEWPHPINSSVARIPNGLVEGDLGLGLRHDDDNKIRIEAKGRNAEAEAELLIAGVPLITVEQLDRFGLATRMGHESNMGGTPLKIQAVLPSYDSEHPFIFMRHDNYWGTDGPDIPLEIARKMYDDPRGHEHVRVNGYAGGVAPEEWSDYFDADGKHLLPFALEKTALELIATGGPANIQRANEIRKGRRYVEDPAKEAVKAVMPYGYHIDTPEALVYFVSALREYGLVEPVARNSETLGTNTSGLALQASELLPNVRYALHLEGDKSVSTDENGNPFIVEAYTDAYSWELLLKQTLIDRPDVSAARLYWPQEFSAEARFMPLGAIETSGKGLAKKLDSETEYVVISNKQTRANFLVPKISR